MGFDLYPGSFEGGGWIGGLSRKLGLSPPLEKKSSAPTVNSGPRLVPDSRYVPRTTSSNRSSGSSIADILTRLESLQDSSRYLTPFEELERQARSQASSQYDPIISQLRSQMEGAQRRAGSNRTEVGRMFESLASDLGKSVPYVESIYKDTQQDTASKYSELRDRIGQQYSSSQQEQEALLKRLNIEAAAPDTMATQQRDKDYFTNLANVEGQTADTAIGMEGRAATEFTRRGGDLAKIEGTQRQADILTELENYLSEVEAQIGAQEIARDSSFTSLLSQLQSENSNQARQLSQRDFENYISSINLGRQLKKDELESLSTSAGAVKSPADVATRALGLGLDSSSTQAVQNVFLTSLLEDQVIAQGIDPNYGTSLTKEALAARMIEAGRNSGLNQRQLNALQTIALEYFGRR